MFLHPPLYTSLRPHSAAHSISPMVESDKNSLNNRVDYRDPSDAGGSAGSLVSASGNSSWGMGTVSILFFVSKVLTVVHLVLGQFNSLFGTSDVCRLKTG